MLRYSLLSNEGVLEIPSVSKLTEKQYELLARNIQKGRYAGEALKYHTGDRTDSRQWRVIVQVSWYHNCVSSLYHVFAISLESEKPS